MKPKNSIQRQGQAHQSEGVVVQQTAQFRSGPLPDPLSFAEYNEVLPGAAERLLTMVEKEQKHRMEMDVKDHELSKFAIQERYSVLKRGQVIAGGLAAFATGGGIYSIVQGSGWFGTAAILGTLVTLATAFIVDRRRSAPPAVPPDSVSKAPAG